ncbi:MAG: helix-turn-helix domain-containing protein [Tissierellaceae bacterium]|nr:helix-turn-helix domain-containing protein [Tissierellaceae bacterium]
MNQKNIGLFLRDLRKEKDLTQEQLAEILGVSNRSISRWENGVNMPDIDLVIEMAKFYDVSIEEMLDGERKENIVDRKKEESLLKVAEYSNDEKIIFSKRLCYIFIAGLIALVVYIILETQGFTEIDIYNNIASFTLGFVFSVLLLGIIFTSRYMLRIRAFKLRVLDRYK